MVGVDGSAASAAALRWGVAEAERLRLPVEAVFAVPEERQDEAAIDPAALLSALVHTAVPAGRHRRQPLSHRVLRGEPASVLTEQSDRACFLVIGRRRGRDPLRTSTTARCLRGAACPVAVVPANVPGPGIPTVAEPSAQAYGEVGDRPVGDVMTPNVPGVDAASGVDVALRLMVGAGVHHLPVMEQDRCVGLLSETDAVWRLASWPVRDGPPAVRDLARESPPLVPADHTVRQAATTLLQCGGDALLVTDDDRIVGLLTSDEVATLLADEPSGAGPREAPGAPRETTARRDERDAAIVVGIDGSTGAQRALDWAVGLAEPTGSVVRAVSACVFVPTPRTLLAPSHYVDPDADALGHEHVRLAVQQADPGSRGVKVEACVAHGEPGHVLCALAAGASALVVGSKGRGAVLAALLGSVSTYCVRNAKCPVFVIPPGAGEKVRPVGTTSAATDGAEGAGGTRGRERTG